MESNPEPLTSNDLAKLLRVHIVTLRRMQERGDAPPVIRLGAGFRYRRDDVDQWLSDQIGKDLSAP